MTIDNCECDNCLCGGDKSFPVTIDYGLDIDGVNQLIHAGVYTHVLFPRDQYVNWRDLKYVKITSAKKQVEVKLENFGRVMTTKEVLDALDKKGLRPAMFIELLAVGAKYPEVQRKASVFALGSIWIYNGQHHIAGLYGDSSMRGISTTFYDRTWSKTCLFAAVKK